ncbi:hypothetical protein [Oceanobacillus salinisoli]|uniref:hypothetical protein n=1 Tax=Oceanobacillus salinisoli TaxID=2678611 RepID=UPI0012E29142|nr:hypothetical protein [Oceanobacillus salinisoli]
MEKVNRKGVFELGILIIIIIAYAPLFYRIHKRLNFLEEQNRLLKEEIDRLK